MNACLQNAYTKVGNRSVSVEAVVTEYERQCQVRLEACKKKKKRRGY